MESQLPKKIRYTNRWFCYLDLLGFRNLVQSKDIEQVLPIYEEALSHLENAAQNKARQGIMFSWFSDTFILYSKSGRAEDFALLEQAGRLFFRELIKNEIPVRGALTYGKLYSQQERNIFIGPALIDAYHYGEGQDWLGFVLTPSAITQLTAVGIPATERLNYRKVTDPAVLKPGVEGPVYAFCFGDGSVQGKNRYLAPLESMKKKAGASQASKYEKTIEFLNSHNQVGGRKSAASA